MTLDFFILFYFISLMTCIISSGSCKLLKITYFIKLESIHLIDMSHIRPFH